VTVGQDTTGLRIRPAARAILLTPRHEVLLVRFEFPTRQAWALPGGGIDDGETPDAALRRELLEELGHAPETIGPHVWSRLHVIPFPNGLWDGQCEQIHLVPVDATFDPQPHLTWEQLNSELVFELRWWTVEDILAATELHFVPANLGALLRDLIDDGPPKTPIDVGI
jgi:8-oxo-dGTP pyrophosphatase MutT (NUDIX family)